MPLIAIARCSRLSDYEHAVRGAGGEPWVIDRTEHQPADVLGTAAGLLLTGGDDVNPSIYGEAPHPSFNQAETGRDEYEIELVRLALEKDLPLFAICRGIQVLNVARGGTLVQDIPTEVPDALEHRLPVPPHAATAMAHEIRMEERSLLRRLIGDHATGRDTCEVNSRHHQAVRMLGQGLLTAAVAPDGVVEAVEDPGRRFCLGVQWHPEHFHRMGQFQPLFEGFVLACRRG